MNWQARAEAAERALVEANELATQVLDSVQLLLLDMRQNTRTSDEEELLRQVAYQVHALRPAGEGKP